MRVHEPEPERTFHFGIDIEFAPKMLVAIHPLARCFDVSVSTIRRWSRNGEMPKPRKIGGRTLWSADELREWIRRGCPDLSQEPHDE